MKKNVITMSIDLLKNEEMLTDGNQRRVKKMMKSTKAEPKKCNQTAGMSADCKPWDWLWS